MCCYLGVFPVKQRYRVGAIGADGTPSWPRHLCPVEASADFPVIPALTTTIRQPHPTKNRHDQPDPPTTRTRNLGLMVFCTKNPARAQIICLVRRIIRTPAIPARSVSRPLSVIPALTTKLAPPQGQARLYPRPSAMTLSRSRTHAQTGLGSPPDLVGVSLHLGGYKTVWLPPRYLCANLHWLNI